MPGPPKESPRPDVFEPDVEEPTNPHTKRSNSLTRLVSLGVAGGFSVLTLGSVAFAWDKLETKAKDAGTTSAAVVVAPIVASQAAHEARIQMLEQATRQTQADVHEARGELRDLYRAIMDNKRSDRLESPPPPLDGGSR